MQTGRLHLDPAREDHIFDLVETDCSYVDKYAGILDATAHQQCPGIVVRGLYGSRQIAEVNERLSRNEPRHLRVAHGRSADNPDQEPVHYFGLNLVNAKPDLNAYLDFAVRFRVFSAELFESLPTFEAVIRQTLERLVPPRRVLSPRFEDDRLYGPATIRIFPPGTEVPPHCGNTMLRETAQYAHLRTLVGRADQLSYFMLINKPDSGGQLVLYDLVWQASNMQNRDSVRLDYSEVVNRRWQPVRLSAGDLIIFNGGRIYHSVTRIEGKQPRRTIGGFLSFSRDASAIYYYS